MMPKMDSSKIPTREELYRSELDRLESHYAVLTKYGPRVLAFIQFTEREAALVAPNESIAKEHFRKSAEAAKRIFEIAWESQDEKAISKLFSDPFVVSANMAIEGLHVALAAEDWETMRYIATHSDFSWSNKMVHGQVRRYAAALRRFILENDYSGFREIKRESGILNFSYLAEILATSEYDPNQAIEMLEVFSEKADKYIGLGFSMWQGSVPAVRNLILLKHPDIAR